MGWEESKCSGVDNRYERVWPLELIVWRGDCWVDGGGCGGSLSVFGSADGEQDSRGGSDNTFESK